MVGGVSLGCYEATENRCCGAFIVAVDVDVAVATEMNCLDNTSKLVTIFAVAAESHFGSRLDRG